MFWVIWPWDMKNLSFPARNWTPTPCLGKWSLNHWTSREVPAAAKSLQSCPTLCDPIDGSPPGSPVSGILQARTLGWVAISFSNAWKWKVKGKSLSRVQLLVTPWTAAHQAPPSMGFSRQEYWSGVPSPSRLLTILSKSSGSLSLWFRTSFLNLEPSLGEAGLRYNVVFIMYLGFIIYSISHSTSIYWIATEIS